MDIEKLIQAITRIYADRGVELTIQVTKKPTEESRGEENVHS